MRTPADHRWMVGRRLRGHRWKRVWTFLVRRSRAARQQSDDLSVAPVDRVAGAPAARLELVEGEVRGDRQSAGHTQVYTWSPYQRRRSAGRRRTMNGLVDRIVC